MFYIIGFSLTALSFLAVLFVLVAACIDAAKIPKPRSRREWRAEIYDADEAAEDAAYARYSTKYANPQRIDKEQDR